MNDIGGKSVHITKQGNKPPNLEEEKNDPLVKGKCSHKFVWLDFKGKLPIESKLIIFNFLDLI